MACSARTRPLERKTQTLCAYTGRDEVNRGHDHSMRTRSVSCAAAAERARWACQAERLQHTLQYQPRVNTRRCAVQTGDSCELGRVASLDEDKPSVALGVPVPEAWRPSFGADTETEGTRRWDVKMLPGPQAAPDYFTEEDMEV